MISVEVDLDSVADMIHDHIVSLEQFRPAAIDIDCDHTIYVEFGTRPVTTRTSTTKEPRVLAPGVVKEMSDMAYNLFKWVGRANPGISLNEQLFRADRLYRKICDKGLEPRPFIRPAIQEAEESILKDLADGMSFHDIAESVKDRMLEILDANTMASAKDDDEFQSLQNSISVRFMDPEELDEGPIIPDAAKDIPEEKWHEQN